MRLAPVAALFVLLVAVALWLFTRDPEPAAVPAVDAAQPTSAPALAAELVAAPLHAPPAEPAADARTALATPAEVEPEPPAQERCSVFGRVVDEHDAPLAGVRVELAAYREWAAGHDVPRLPASRYDYRGWRLVTDARGAFRIDVPVPTNERTWLTITPSDFLADETRRFGGDDSQSEPALRPGDNDLGVIRLATTGAICGTVRDESGAPLADVELSTGGSRSTTFGHKALTDASGRYVLAHVEPGSYGVKAELDGYLDVFRTPFEVERGRYIDGVDFVLARAPTIAGRVVDEAGAPVADVRLWGWPSSSGAGAGARTAVDGTFVVHLPQDEPYTLEATHAGYETFGGWNAGHYEPGTSGIEIVLRRSSRTRFVVVDEATGERLTRFGIRVIEKGKGIFTDRPRTHERPDGEVELDGRPGIDRVEAAAPGYALLDCEIEHDEPGSGVQTLRLARGSGVAGRVVRGGEPVADALVRVREHGVRRDAISARTGPGGRFAVRGLDPGQYRIELSDGVGHSAQRSQVRLGRDALLDLGDVEIEPAAAIEGVVLVVQGVSPAGLELYLDDWRSSVRATTDAEGRFRFDGVVPGAHTLNVASAPGVLAVGAPLALELASGETREVTFDARDRAMCAVTIEARFGDAPASGMVVLLVPVAEPDAGGLELGQTDESGRIEGWVRAAGDARVRLRTPAFTHHDHPDALVPLVYGTHPERTLRFDVGGLQVSVPSWVTLPAGARLDATLRAQDGWEETLSLAPDASKTHSFSVDLLPAGSFDLVARVVDPTSHARVVPVDGGWRLQRDCVYEAAVPVEIVAGEVTLVALD